MPENEQGTKIALLGQGMKNMEKKVDNIEKAIKNIPNELEKIFATKLELQEVRADTESHSGIIKWIAGILGSVFTIGIVYIITEISKRGN